MENLIDPALEEYARNHSTEPPELLQELARATHTFVESPEMLTGPLEGRFLKQCVQMIGARKAIEIGMFTGYGTLSIAEGLPPDGKLITCEINPKTIEFAQKYFSRSPHGKKIDIRKGPALETLKTLKPPFDFVFIDADKTNYPHYYEEALRLLGSGGVMAIDNVLWSGRVLAPADASTQAIHSLNETICKDRRVEAVLLTIRDGIQLIRKL